MTEERREQLDESLDKLDKLVQRWNHRLTLGNLDLAKRYLNSEGKDTRLRSNRLV